MRDGVGMAAGQAVHSLVIGVRRVIEIHGVHRHVEFLAVDTISDQRLHLDLAVTGGELNPSPGFDAALGGEGG